MFENIIHGVALVAAAVGAFTAFAVGDATTGAWAVAAGIWVVSSWGKAARLARA